MKAGGAVLAFFLLMTSFAFAEKSPPNISLLDMKKKAKLVDQGTCDKKNTKIFVYENDREKFDIMEVQTKSGIIFFTIRKGNMRYDFIQHPRLSIPTYIPNHSSWDQELKNASPNFYSFHHNTKHDCRFDSSSA